jgi:hypothetical protein
MAITSAETFKGLENTQTSALLIEKMPAVAVTADLITESPEVFAAYRGQNPQRPARRSR